MSCLNTLIKPRFLDLYFESLLSENFKLFSRNKENEVNFFLEIKQALGLL